MKAFEIVGHSYNESIFCVDCSMFNADLDGEPEDDNGNPIHVILAGDEDADVMCDDCGCVLLTGELPEKPENADADDSCADDHVDRPAIRFSHDDSEDYYI